MAPIKQTKQIQSVLQTRNCIVTRSKKTLTTASNKELRGKRKANSPPPKEVAVKRTAFCDVTNAVTKKIQETKSKTVINKNNTLKKVTVQSKILPSVKTAVKSRHNENVVPQAPGKVQRKTNQRQVVPTQTAQKPKEPSKDNTNNAKVKVRLSNEFEKSGESLYKTALEEINTSSQSNSSASSRHSTRSKTSSNTSSPKITNLTLVAEQFQNKLNLGDHDVPEGVINFDKENWNDIFQVSHYAMDIFNYFKTRELKFVISDYMERQVCLNQWMRSLLVDWMVEIQESFELNHETLYLGVKLVDFYLSRMTVGKETLQLVGATAMFIACKFDERIPPLIDDFLYICDGAYNRRQLIRMEINLLKVCNFDLGIPISYRFLRRFARCAKVTMPILTLARFILEHSLMDYSTVIISDSKIAASCLYLALQMKHISGWTPTLEFYTGYKLDEILDVVHLLNNGLHRKPKEELMTVRNKYSHKIFFEVAKTPLIKNENLEA